MVAVSVKSMCCIQREIGTVSQHGSRACIFYVPVSICWRKTGNEELITMLVCRDVDSFWTERELEKNVEIRWTEPMPHGSSSKSRQINLAHSFVWNYTNWTNAPNNNESRLETFKRSSVETRLASTVSVFSVVMWCHPVNTSRHSPI